MAVSRVQYQTGFGNHSATSYTTSLPGPTTAGNLLVVGFADGGYPTGFTSGWTLLSTDGNTGNHGSRIYGKVAAGGDTMPTITNAGAYNVAWIATEWSGLDLSGGITPAYTAAIVFGIAGALDGVSLKSNSITPAAGDYLFVAADTWTSQNTTDDTTPLPAGWSDSFIQSLHAGINAGGGSGPGVDPLVADTAFRVVSTSGSTSYQAGVNLTGYNPTPSGTPGSAALHLLAWKATSASSGGMLDFINDQYTKNGALVSTFATAVSSGYVTFSRSTVGYYHDNTGASGATMQSFAVDTLRRGSVRGALLETANVNYAQQSKVLGSYTLSGTTQSANLNTAPDGTAAEADALIQTATTAVHSAAAPSYIPPLVGVNHVFSVFLRVRAGTGNLVQVAAGSAGFGVDAWVNFDISTGSFGSVGVAVVAYGVEQINTVYYRVWFVAPCTAVASAGAIFIYFISSLTDGRAPSFLGATGNSCTVWGGQTEIDDGTHKASTFISTTTATARRGADQLGIALDAGNWDIRFTFDDNTVKTWRYVTGNVTWIVPIPNLPRSYIKTIEWFPAVASPVGTWDFVNDTYTNGTTSATGFAAAVTAGLATFARALAADYTDGSGTANLQVFASGALRRGLRGALLESAATQQVADQATVGNYSLNGVTVTSNLASPVTPEGTANIADALVQTATAAAHSWSNTSHSQPINQIYVYSGYFAAGAGTVYLQLIGGSNSGGANTYASFDLSTKTWGAIGSNVLSYGYEVINSTWTRVWIRFPSVSSTLNNTIAFAFTDALATASRAPTFTGSTSNSIVQWGGQVENDTPDGKPSSIIVGASGTVRPADALTVTLPSGTWDVQVSTDTPVTNFMYPSQAGGGAWAVPTGLGNSYIKRVRIFTPGTLTTGAMSSAGSASAAFFASGGTTLTGALSSNGAGSAAFTSSALKASPYSMTGAVANAAFVAYVPKAYYFSAAGSDANDGLTTATPKKTIAAANALALNPGDSINFRGGDTFVVQTTDSNLSVAKSGVKVTSYGTGQATIDGTLNPGSSAIYTEGANVWIDNLKVQGPGIATSTSGGILTWPYTGDAGTSDYWKVTRNTVDGFQKGIWLGGDVGNHSNNSIIGGSAGQGNVLTNCIDGIILEPANAGVNVITNITISYNTLSDMDEEGISLGANSQTAINGFLVERNSVTRVNPTRHAIGGGGASGIIVWAASNGTVQYNESSFVHATSTGVDGIGIDVECSIGVVVQWNYTHDCGGPGLMRYDWSGGQKSQNVYWYDNLVVGCATEAGSTYGMMMIGSAATAATGDRIVNNTFVATAGSTRTFLAVNATPSSPVVYNNMFVGNGVLTMKSGTGTLATVDHNLEYNISGATYGTNVVTGNPLLVNPLPPPPFMTSGWDATVVNGYRVQSTSPAINAGIDTTSVGITLPPTDLWGNTLGTMPPNIGAYDGSGAAGTTGALSSAGTGVAQFSGTSGTIGTGALVTAGYGLAAFQSAAAAQSPYSMTGAVAQAQFGGNTGLSSPFSMTGAVATAQFQSSATAKSPFSSNGVGVAQFSGTASVGASGALATAGTSTVLFQSAAAAQSPYSMQGSVATVQFQSAALAAVTFRSDGTGVAQFSGQAFVTNTGAFVTAGFGLAAFQSTALAASPYSMAGAVATVQFGGAATVSRTYAMQGSVATVQFQSSALKQSPFSAQGTGVAQFGGQFVIEKDGVFQSLGAAATALFASAAISPASFLMDGATATVQFGGALKIASSFAITGSVGHAQFVGHLGPYVDNYHPNTQRHKHAVTIQVPTQDARSLQTTAEQLKEAVETMQGTRQASKKK